MSAHRQRSACGSGVSAKNYVVTLEYD